MIVLVCGGRSYTSLRDDREFLRASLDRLHAQHRFTLVVEGGANGADRAARLWAHDRCIHVATVMALWDCYGRRAGPVRNDAMLILKPELVIAFPGGSGTAHMIRAAQKAGIPVVQPAGAT